MIDWQYEACKILKLVLQARAPYDTGNLAINSIRIAADYSAVLIGGEIADYAAQTNEPWTAEKWQGKKNPNEGWIQRAVQEALPMIGQALSGKLTREDISVFTNQYKTIYNNRKREVIKRKREKQEKIV